MFTETNKKTVAGVTRNQSEELFSDFPPVSKREWEEHIRNDLNDADYLKILTWDTLEGFSVPPFFTRDDFRSAEYPNKAIQSSKWLCCEWVEERSPEDANLAVKKAIEGGVDACLFHSCITADPDKDNDTLTGVSVQNQADLEKLLEGMDHRVEVIFDCGMAAPLMMAMIRNYSKSLSRVTTIFDPLTEAAKAGRLPAEESEIKRIIDNLIEETRHDFLCADGSFYHNAGSSIVLELGIVLAIGSDYLAMVNDSFRLKMAENLFIKLGIGPLYFPEIAKYRAIRMLWTKMLNGWGIKNQIPLRIFAETGKTNKPITDVHNNILRSVTESMSAVIGGTDVLIIHPFDMCTRDAAHFSSRVSRNIQHILREEARFNMTDDPSSGCYYIEFLTDTIARNAWKIFQHIEREGGFLRSLKNGFIQRQIQESKEIKEAAYHSGRRVLIGTNHYANPGEKLPVAHQELPSFEQLKKPLVVNGKPPSGFQLSNLENAVAAGMTLSDLFYRYFKPGKERFLPIQEYRAGAVFDTIRLRTENQTRHSGRRPSVCIIPVGNSKWRNARARFAQQVFGCAGFEVTQLRGAHHFDDVISQSVPFSSDVYVLCSSDKEYDVVTIPFCKHFSGKGILVMAGKPACKEELFRKNGVNDFIYQGMNLPDFLNTIQHSICGREDAV